MIVSGSLHPSPKLLLEEYRTNSEQVSANQTVSSYFAILTTRLNPHWEIGLLYPGNATTAATGAALPSPSSVRAYEVFQCFSIVMK